MDEYQSRYLAHQVRKKNVLINVMKQRHSTRMFSEREVEQKVIDEIIESTSLCPSSCDRHGVKIRQVVARDDKALLGGLLVGGVGYIHRAPVILMLFGDPVAYKENLLYMPYLDAGVVLYHLHLMAEHKGLKACYVNPQVRGDHQLYFRDRFGHDIFCGAVGIGYEYTEEK